MAEKQEWIVSVKGLLTESGREEAETAFEALKLASIRLRRDPQQLQVQLAPPRVK